MNDELSHLKALEQRLCNEKARLSIAQTANSFRDIEFRQAEIKSVEKEIKGEIDFLATKGIVVVSKEISDLSDDELLDELMK